MGSYDNSIRDLIAERPRALAELLLGIDLSTITIRYGPTEFAGEPLRADSIIELDARCLHVEIQLRASATDIEPRLVAYWARLRHRYGSAPEQFVVVLDPKGGRLSGTYSDGNLTLSYNTLHLWDRPSDELFDLPSLYPLAVLGATNDRERVFAEIARRIRREHGDLLGERIVKNTAALANLYLPRPTLESILRRTDMPIDLRELPMVQEALEEGLEQGRDESRHALLDVAIEKFGPLPEILVMALLDSSRDFATVTRAVVRSAAIADLRIALA